METPCMNWLGGTNLHGYGYTKWRGKRAYMHRIFWELFNGPIPDGMYVCHKCDNPSCVRPDHLFLGTAADNARDMVLKHRSATCENHSQAKLTTGMVRAIREMAADPSVEYKTIAERFGITYKHISRICSGKRWAHAPGPIQTTDRRHFSPQARAARHKKA